MRNLFSHLCAGSLQGMALLLLILLAATLIFLFYYELIWKGFEKKHGKSLVAMLGDFIFLDTPRGEAAPAAIASDSPWLDNKYRLTVELYRRDQMGLDQVAQIVGISTTEAEQYLDELEGEGKIQQVGDAERGIFYKSVF